jgi:hypothetical protein
MIFPHLRENYFACRIHEIVVTFLDMPTDDFNMEKCLFDELFNAL